MRSTLMVAKRLANRNMYKFFETKITEQFLKDIKI